MAPDSLSYEPDRLAALQGCGILDTPDETPFEDIVDTVAAALGVPMCAVSLVDRDRNWLKALRGPLNKEIPRENSFCTHALSSYEPFVVNDTLDHPALQFNPGVLNPPNIRSYAGVPLTDAKGYNLGTLCVVDVVPRRFSDGELALLRRFATLAMREIELRERASVDRLTGLLTRQLWEDASNRDIARARRHRHPVSLICLDIDRFKAVNDTHGHQAGDAVLRGAARLLQDCVRETDIVGRIGGEEFAVLCPVTDAAQAATLAERCRATLEETPIACGGVTLNVTASFGVAQLDLEGEESLDSVLARADAALYAAKHGGRNRVEISPGGQG